MNKDETGTRVTKKEDRLLNMMKKAEVSYAHFFLTSHQQICFISNLKPFHTSAIRICRTDLRNIRAALWVQCEMFGFLCSNFAPNGKKVEWLNFHSLYQINCLLCMISLPTYKANDLIGQTSRLPQTTKWFRIFFKKQASSRSGPAYSPAC